MINDLIPDMNAELYNVIYEDANVIIDVNLYNIRRFNIIHIDIQPHGRIFHSRLFIIFTLGVKMSFVINYLLN
jgi:hypothetical protein